MRGMTQMVAAGAVGTAMLVGPGTPEAMGAQADCSAEVAAAVHTAQHSLRTNTHFSSLVLRPHNDKNNFIEVVDPSRPGYEIIDPLAVRCNAQIVGYIGRKGMDSVAEIPANKHTQITEHKRHETITIKRSQQADFVMSRTLHPSPDSATMVSYFADGRGHGYGSMP